MKKCESKISERKIKGRKISKEKKLQKYYRTVQCAWFSVAFVHLLNYL